MNDAKAKDRDSTDGNPNYLYRFRACNKNSLSELANSNIWFSTLDMFNDPFEVLINQFRFIGNFEKQKHLKSMEEELNEYFEISVQLIAETVKSVGVLCFSSKNDNHLMWSHYADSHKGFCLGYKRNSEENVWRATRPVNYVDDITDLFNAIAGSISNWKVRDHRPPEEVIKNAEKVIYTKNSQWEYENEWRLIDGNNGSGLTRIPVDISRIIFGFRMPSTDKQAVYNLTKSIDGIKYFQCTGAIGNDFAMDIEELPGELFK